MLCDRSDASCGNRGAIMKPSVPMANVPNARQVKIAGSFAYDNVFLVDGVDVNDNLFGSAHFAFIEDAIEETQILTSGISAEYGRFGGGVINAVTKSGSNAFHGDAYEFLRNSALDARNFFDYSYLATNKRLPQLQRNDFGASLGGPIRKDKTFFYGVYEGLRQHSGASVFETTWPANC